MGHNTTLMILNDQLDVIVRNPERFMTELSGNLRGGTILGQTEVMPTDHADVFRLYCSQGNAIYELSPWARRTMELVARDDHGRSIIAGWSAQALHQLERLEEVMHQ